MGLISEAGKTLRTSETYLTTLIGMMTLSKSCTKITGLSICHCTQITEACLMQVVDNLPHLQHFNCIAFQELSENKFTNEGLTRLLRPSTKTLRVSVHPVDEDGVLNFVQKIQQTGAKLEHLAFVRSANRILMIDPETRCKFIPDTVLIALFTELAHLKSIELRNLDVTDDAMRFLVTSCPNLEKIIVEATPGSDLSSAWLDAVTPSNNKLEHLELLCLLNEDPQVALIKQLATSCPRLTTLKTDCFYFPGEFIAVSNCFPCMQSLDLACHVSFSSTFNGAQLTRVQRNMNIDDVVIRLCCDSWRNLTRLKLDACDRVRGFSQSFLTLSKNAQNLKSLSLHLADEISPQYLADFFYQVKPKLTKLDLYKCVPINDEAMAKILPQVPNLT